MAKAPRSPGDPEFLTNGGLHVFTVAVILALAVDSMLSRHGSWQPPSGGVTSYAFPIFIPFVTGSTMVLVTAVLWGQGYLRRRWRYWVGATVEAPSLWTERPFVYMLKMLVIALAIMAVILMLGLALLAGIAGPPPFEAFVEFYAFSCAIVAPLYFTGLLGLALADLLVASFVRPAFAGGKMKEGRQRLRGMFCCAIYLLVLFDVMLLLPRSVIALFGPKQTVADLIVAGSGPILATWAAVAWLKARRAAR